METPEKLDVRSFARALGTVLSYAAGDIVVREQDPPRYLYVVLSGSVEVMSHRKTIEKISVGKTFGILALLDERPSTITARAAEQCELAVLDRKKFRYMVEEVPNFVWYIMDELAEKLRNTNAAL